MSDAAAPNEATPTHPVVTPAVGEKHEYDSAPVAVMPAPSFGGALTFAEYDTWSDAQSVEMAVSSEMGLFNILLENVRMSDLSAREKASRIRELAGELEGRLTAAQEEAERGERELSGETDEPGVFRAFKDADGQWRWLAIHSNKYRDGEREIFSEDAHRRFVERVEQYGAYPALRLFHVPADFGRADYVDLDDRGFVVSSGTFKDGMDDVAERLAQTKGLGCSHGYWWRPSDLRDGVYNDYHSFEITVLPAERAANKLTLFTAGKEFPVLTPERRRFLEEMAGADRVKQIEADIGVLAEMAKQQGLDYKSVEEARLLQFWPDAAEGVRQGTKRVDGVDLARADFADRGDADSPSTWHLPLTSSQGGSPDAGRIRDAITALQPEGFRGNQVQLSDERSAVIGRIRSAIGQLDSDSDKERLRERLSNLRGAREASENEEGAMPEETTVVGDPVATPPSGEAAAPASAPNATPTEGAADAAPAATAVEPTEEERAAAEDARQAAAALGERASGDPILTIGRALLPLMQAAVKAGIDESVGPLEQRIAAMESDIASTKELASGLRQSRDDELAALVRPRVGPTAAQPASASADNIVSAERAAEIKAAQEGPVKSPADEAVSPYLHDLVGAISRGNGLGPN